MSTLTWRNVDAPNLSSSLDGLRTASSMLGNATRSGLDMVDTIKQANADAADRAILNRALGIQDSDAFRAGLTDGTVVGPDATNASVDTLRSLDNRAGTLLNRDVTRQNLEQTDWTNKRTRDRDARMAAAASDYALASTLARDNNQADLTKLLSTSATLRALDPDQLAGLFTNSDVLSANAQARRASDTGFAQNQWRFGNEVSNAADAKTAQALWGEISRNNATTADVQAAVNKHAATASPGVMAQLNNLARGSGYAINGPVGDGSGGLGVPSGSTGSPTLSGSSPALSIMTGGAALPDTIKTVGDLVDNKSALLKTNPKGTATGLWQITADTWAQFAPAALGQGWKSADVRDPQVQSKVGEAIWNSAKNDPNKIQGRWASVNAQEAKAMQGKTWAEVQDTLSRKESGVAASSLAAAPQEASSNPANQAAALLSQTTSRAANNLGADLVTQMIAERAGQNQAVGIFPELNALQADRRTVGEVVNALTGKDGALAGSDRGDLIDIINRVVQNSGNRINPAMAAEMVRRNMESSDNFFVRGWSRVADVVGTPFGRPRSTPNMEGGVRINDRGLNQMVNDYLTGATSDQRMAQQSLGAESAVVQSLQEQYNAADALYKSMLSQSKSRPGLVGNLEAYKQKRDAAAEALRRATQSAANTGSLTPRYDRPVATTRGASGGW